MMIGPTIKPRNVMINTRITLQSSTPNPFSRYPFMSPRYKDFYTKIVYLKKTKINNLSSPHYFYGSGIAFIAKNKVLYLSGTYKSYKSSLSPIHSFLSMFLPCNSRDTRLWMDVLFSLIIHRIAILLHFSRHKGLYMKCECILFVYLHSEGKDRSMLELELEK